MKKSIEKLRKFFRLEADRGYDNKAVMGGLTNILSSWEMEARDDQLSEQLIQAVVSRLRDYHQLSQDSREVVLKGLWKRIQAHAGTGTATPSQGPSRSESPVPQAAPTAAPSPEADRHPGQDDPAAQPTAGRETAPPEKTRELPEYDLQSPLTVVKGIGDKRSQALSRLGIKKVRDLLFTYPRRHDDYSQLKTIDELEYGEEITVIGTVKRISSRKVKRGRMTLVEAVITDKSGSLRVTWFNQPWLKKQLSRGDHLSLSGKVDQYLGRLTMTNPDWESISEEHLHTNRIVPVYPLTEDINQKWLRKTIHQVLQKTYPLLEDPLPRTVLDQAQKIPLPEAVRGIHFPESQEQLDRAVSRLAFDEIFMLQMGVFRQKLLWEKRTSRVFRVPDPWLADQLDRLPYTLTAAQQRSLSQIREDLASGHPLNRLLQGDVGSGKTAVAALTILMVVESGAQTALMAPTSILAEQHYLSLVDFLSGENSPLERQQIQLLIGSTPEEEKALIREGLASGEIKVVIGTHALLQDPVVFEDLQLAVIDEQHRFGVEQRGTLREKGENPHLLVMTATPIPRSLALTVYGDLDVSVIDEMPPGRQEVKTTVHYPRERERAYSLIRSEVEKGNQAFLIYPLVEETDQSEDRAAEEEFERLRKEVFANFQVGLLHGQLPAEEKEHTMAQFRAGEIQILVATSVIEVGVDIPQATVMLVEGAHRFGLAQLHQFRGRVGRGEEQAHCLLIPRTAEHVENQRLQAMQDTNDGFELAEIDLELRGPGQFLGTRQSGFSELQLAEISDIQLIEEARRCARELLKADPDLSLPEHQALAEEINQFWTEQDGGDIS